MEKVSREEWESECLKWHGVVLTGLYSHWCPEWDFLPIDETCGEFQCCTCNIKPQPDEMENKNSTEDN